MSIEDKLAGYEETYEEDKKGSGGDSWGVLGTYNWVLERAEWITKKQDGSLSLKMTFAVTDGDYRGQRRDEWMNFDHEVSRQIWLGNLRIMGVMMPDKIRDLREAVDKWAPGHPRVKFSLVEDKSGKYINSRNFELLAAVSEKDEIPPRPSVDDEDSEPDGDDLKAGSFVEVKDLGEGTVVEIDNDAEVARVCLVSDPDADGEWYPPEDLTIIEKLTAKKPTRKKRTKKSAAKK